MARPIFEIVEVRWIDSVGIGRWRPLGELRGKISERFLYHRSVGYVADETDESLLLVGSYQEEIDDDELPDARNVSDGVRIPKVAILSRRTLGKRVGSAQTGIATNAEGDT